MQTYDARYGGVCRSATAAHWLRPAYFSESVRARTTNLNVWLAFAVLAVLSLAAGQRNPGAGSNEGMESERRSSA